MTIWFCFVFALFCVVVFAFHGSESCHVVWRAGTTEKVTKNKSIVQPTAFLQIGTIDLYFSQ